MVLHFRQDFDGATVCAFSHLLCPTGEYASRFTKLTKLADPGLGNWSCKSSMDYLRELVGRPTGSMDDCHQVTTLQTPTGHNRMTATRPCAISPPFGKSLQPWARLATGGHGGSQADCSNAPAFEQVPATPSTAMFMSNADQPGTSGKVSQEVGVLLSGSGGLAHTVERLTQRDVPHPLAVQELRTTEAQVPDVPHSSAMINPTGLRSMWREAVQQFFLADRQSAGEAKVRPRHPSPPLASPTRTTASWHRCASTS